MTQNKKKEEQEDNQASESTEATEAQAKVRRSVEKDPAIVARQIREQRRQDGVDPTAIELQLHQRHKKKGWRYKWILNTANRILKHQQLGYQVDESVEPVAASKSVDGQRLIRMMIPEEIAKEDFAKKQSVIDKEEDDLKRADVKGGTKAGSPKEGGDGAYGDVKIGQTEVKLGSTKG